MVASPPEAPGKHFKFVIWTSQHAFLQRTSHKNRFIGVCGVFHVHCCRPAWTMAAKASKTLKRPLLPLRQNRGGCLRRRGPGGRFAPNPKNRARKCAKAAKNRTRASCKAARDRAVRRLAPRLATRGQLRAAMLKGLPYALRSLQRSLQLAREKPAAGAKAAAPPAFLAVKAVYDVLCKVAEGPRDVSATKIRAVMLRQAKNKESVPSLRSINYFVKQGRETGPKKRRWAAKPDNKLKADNDPSYQYKVRR
jgi:hypothetical protein